MHLVPLVHDTELSSSPPPGWRGDGLGRTCQVRPFHRSARVKFWKPEVPGICPRNQPTAMQLAALGQDTSLRLALITDCAVAAEAGPPSGPRGSRPTAPRAAVESVCAG